MSRPLQHAEGIAATEAPARELGMRVMLSCVIFFIAVSDAFSLPLSLGPGLSAKNALLYMLAVGLIAKFAVQGRFKLEVPGILVCFAVLIGYAIITLLNAALVVDYPRYDLVRSGIRLKSILVDQLMFFAVFFYGLHASANALSVLRVLLVAVVFANAVAVLAALGLIDIGGEIVSRTGRMEGAMGEANQYGAYLVLFLPALLNQAFHSRGLMRLLWIGGVFISTAALIMTVSRGAFLAALVASAWGAYTFRRHFSLAKIAAVISGGTVIAALALAVISARYGGLLYERLFKQSGGELVEISSGRSETWAEAIGRMAETPVTLLSGFGWDVYDTMPFRYSAHNHYLSLWFNLGLPGLLAGLLLLVQLVRRSRIAAMLAADPYRWVLIAFGVGVFGIAVAIFFVELYAPWIWFWVYGGLVLRIAVNTERQQAESLARTARTTQRERGDVHGWRAPPHAAKSRG